MATACRPLREPAEFTNPNVVKVVHDEAGRALYFSRAPVPWPHATPDLPPPAARVHIGLYAYRRDVLLRLAALAPVDLERARGARAAPRAGARHRHSRRGDRLRLAWGSTPPRTSNGSGSGCWPDEDLRPTMEQTVRPTKYIFVTGGVVSSLGKGLAAASIGALLEGHGYKVTLQKFDPYINVDPGHDEPVPARRGLRHRRRGRDGPRPRALRAVHEHDRDAQQQLDDRQDLHVGDPEGAPRRLSRAHRAGHSAHHQRDQGLHPRRRAATSTWCWSRSAARSATSRACRSSRRFASSARTSAARTRIYIHLTLVPYIGAAGELKTKPTQHSVRDLRSIGIQPDILLCRTDRPLPRDIKQKIGAVLRRQRRSGHHRARRLDHLRSAAGAAAKKGSTASC